MKAVLSSALAAVLVAAVWTGAAVAHDYTLGAIKIGHPWARATPKGAKVGGAYMTLTNTGTEPDRLTAGTAAIAGKVELHEVTEAGGVTKMRALPKGLEIKPGETVKLEPGSFHVMLIDLKEPLAKGAKFMGTLMFEKAGRIEVEFRIEDKGSPGTDDHHGDHHGK
jgi:copper(I)-binding protein